MTKKKQQKNKKTTDKRALVKKEDKAVIEKMTVEEAKDFLNQIAYDCDPKRIMKELSEVLLPQIRAGKANKKVREKTAEVASKALMVYGLETHYPLAETVDKKYRPLVIEFSNRLIKEYNCQTSSERALAEVIVSAYAKILEYSRCLYTCRKIDWLSNEKISYYSMISKELDRANRQFITALTTLKQIKMPSFEINVKTKAAFVAQNQQLNVNPTNKNNLNKNEKIKPK